MSKRRMYRVSWTIDIEAKSPRDAARQALEIQRDINSAALSFDVTSLPGKHYTQVDFFGAGDYKGVL